MTESVSGLPGEVERRPLLRYLNALSTPLLAILTAFVLGALVIWLTSGDLTTVLEAYSGLFRGALTKERGLSESLIATVPYILLSLGVAVGFKAGLFNIGVEGQFYVGAVCAAWIGAVFRDLPAIIHLPLAIGAGAIGGAIWGGIPGYLKAKTGAHEVINTIMMNYVAFRLVEFLISGPLKDPNSSAVQSLPVASGAQVWTMYEVPQRLRDPLNALAVAILFAFLAWLLGRWLVSRASLRQRIPSDNQRRWVAIGFGLVIGVLTFVALPPLTRLWWPFQDPYDRLHIGLFIALLAAVLVWWVLLRPPLGFGLRPGGGHPDAARPSWINIYPHNRAGLANFGGAAGLTGEV